MKSKRTHACMHTHTHTRTPMCTYTHTRVFVCTHTHTLVCLCAHIHSLSLSCVCQVYVQCACVCVRAHMRVCRVCGLFFIGIISCTCMFLPSFFFLMCVYELTSCAFTFMQFVMSSSSSFHLFQSLFMHVHT